MLVTLVLFVCVRNAVVLLFNAGLTCTLSGLLFRKSKFWLVLLSRGDDMLRLTSILLSLLVALFYLVRLLKLLRWTVISVLLLKL